MKIAFLVNQFPALSQTFIAHLAQGLVAQGCAVDIYAMHGPGDREMTIGPEIGLRQFRLRERPRQRAVLAAPALARLISRHGAKGLRALSADIYGADASTLVSLHEADMFGNGRYDIVHCQFGPLADIALNHRRAGFLSGRVIVHFRGYDISSHVEQHGRDVYARAFAEADAFFTNCEFFRKKLIDMGGPGERTAVMPSPISVENFPYRARCYRPRETLRLVCVGRLVEKKGFAYAISAIGRLADAGVDVECEIIGDGPLRAQLEAPSSQSALCRRAAPASSRRRPRTGPHHARAFRDRERRRPGRKRQHAQGSHGGRLSVCGDYAWRHTRTDGARRRRSHRAGKR
jgi:colanic acid/amylovoran biosynthesis glycosyltransferase